MPAAGEIFWGYFREFFKTYLFSNLTYEIRFFFGYPPAAKQEINCSWPYQLHKDVSPPQAEIFGDLGAPKYQFVREKQYFRVMFIIRGVDNVDNVDILIANECKYKCFYSDGPITRIITNNSFFQE